MRTELLSLIFCTAACTLATAQDSVSKLQSLPGDAVSAYNAAEQQNDFIVDQAALHSSWGNVFQIAPIVKHSSARDSAPDFFTSLSGAQGISQLTLSGVSFARPSYSLWTTQGAGVNNDPLRNDPGTPVDASALNGFQFAVCTAEFGTGTTSPTGNPASLNNVLGAVVNFTADRPSRLYVTRVAAAENSPSEGCGLAQFGVGAVDETGAIHFRADDGGDCGGFTGLSGNNLFRVRTLARNTSTLNVISAAGGGDASATNWLLQGSAATYNTPNMIPNAAAGRPILIATNFGMEYVYEQVPGSTITAGAGSHFAAGVTDQRGAVGYSPHNFPSLFAGTATGTAAHLAYTSASLADSLNVFGLDANGAFTTPIVCTLPASITDPDQPSWSSTNVPGTQQFDHYHSQVAFRGGSSQVAVGMDQAGNLLLAGVVYYGGPAAQPNLNPNNYVAVARIDPAGNTAWSVAGWTEEAAPNFNGKTIYANATTPIGRMTGGFFGPPISAPMIDSVGNVWFLSAIEISGTPTVGLLRAVYDAASFSYRLELVFQQRDVFPGLNSGTPYQIRFLQITDGDSVSSGTAWSGNISSATYQNVPVASLATSDSSTLGGMVIAAGIIYDVNGDGQFIRSVGVGGDPTSPDEDYQVLLYVSAGADCNNNGIPDDKDIADGSSTDVNGNAFPDDCEGFTGAAFCFGDGSLPTACPCGNIGATGHGCENSAGTGGSVVSGSGILNPDMLVLTANGELPSVLSVFLQGDITLPNGVIFGDGLRCAGGNLKRIAIKFAVAGTVSYPEPGDLGIRARSAQLGDVIPPGGIRDYQVYYRDPNLGFCSNPPGNSWNVSNGLQITWP